MMKRTFENIYTEHKILCISFSASLSLLIILVVLQYFDFRGLKLDIRWIILSGIPLLVGLFIGGYIKTFKGFGFELEASLKEKIPHSIILPVSNNAIINSISIDKQSIQFLNSLDPNIRRQINRLKFIIGRQGHYDAYAVQQYFRDLPKLRFLEIVNEMGEFLFLIPFSKMQIRGDLDTVKIQDFLMAIEMQTLDRTYPGAVSDFINFNDSVLIAYQKIIRSTKALSSPFNDKQLPILDDAKHVIGLVSKQKLEELISREVIKNYEENKNVR